MCEPFFPNPDSNAYIFVENLTKGCAMVRWVLLGFLFFFFVGKGLARARSRI